MKVVFVNVTDVNEIKQRELKFSNDKEYDMLSCREIIIPLELLNGRVFDYSNSILGRFKSYLLDKKIKKIIGKSDDEAYYILSSVLENAICKTALYSIKNYIDKIFADKKYTKFSYDGNIKKSINKYLEDHIKKHNLQKRDARILMLYENCSNIDYEIVERIIDEYKSLDIYCKTCSIKDVTAKITKINNNYGSSIGIKTRISKKHIKENAYDIYMYMDSSKSDINPPSQLRIYLNNNDEDRYDKYFDMYVNNKLDKKTNKEYVSYAIKKYGKLKTMCLLCKSLNIDNK